MPLFSIARVLHRHRSGFAGFGKQNRRTALVRAASATLAGGLLYATSASPALGAPAYWDTNGTTVGAVNTAGSPANGIWGVNPFWNPQDDGRGVPTIWNSGDTAVFSAGTNASGGLATGANLITISGNQAAAQVT